MSQDHLCSLAIVSIEHEVADTLDFDDIIRKVTLD